DAERLARLQLQVHPADGRDRALGAVVGDGEVVDPEQRHGASPRSRGLNTASRALPHIMNAATTTRIARPGGSRYHQACAETAPLVEARWRIEPHETTFGSPRPSQASDDSMRIAEGTSSVALASTSGSTFGRM